MPDWDEDSPQLRQNLTRILEEIAHDTEERKPPAVAMVRRWQTLFMQGLKPTNPQYIGAFRGESGLKKTRIKIGSHWGVPPAKVAEYLSRHPTLIADLVGLAIANIGLRPVEEMIGEPGCPNLYWALTDLPASFRHAGS